MQKSVSKLNKLDKVIIYLLSVAKKKKIKNLSKIQIMKLIFMLEIESHRFIGKSFFDNLHFVREKNGPISTDIYDSLGKLSNSGYINLEVTKKKDYPYPRHGYSLLKNSEVDINDNEKIFLSSIFEDFLPLNQKELKNIAYSTEPMKDILSKEEKSGMGIFEGMSLNFNLVPLDEDVVDLIIN